MVKREETLRREEAYPSILIETIGGAGRGLGHVFRAAALGKALFAKGAIVSMSAIGREALRVILDTNLPIRNCMYPPDIAITDFPPEEKDLGRHKGFTVDVVDEPEEAVDSSDLIFSNFKVHKSMWTNQYHGGLEWAILRDEFRESAVYCPQGYIAITLGGVDPMERTGDVAEVLRRKDKHVIPLMGTGFKKEVPGAIAGVSVRELLSSASVAVVNGGQTLLECAALGIPAVVLAANKRERDRVSRLNKLGAPWFRIAESVKAIPYAVEAALESAFSLRENGIKKVDGLGAERVADKILETWRGSYTISRSRGTK